MEESKVAAPAQNVAPILASSSVATEEEKINPTASGAGSEAKPAGVTDNNNNAQQVTK